MGKETLEDWQQDGKRYEAGTRKCFQVLKKLMMIRMLNFEMPFIGTITNS